MSTVKALMNRRDRRSGMLTDLLNFLTVPIRLMIPQPLLAKMPFLRTNEDERLYRVLAEYRGAALDIGCGNNRVIKTYRSEGHRGLGVDVYSWEGPDMIVEDTAILPFDSQSFDTISFVACLNHIPNRGEVLLEARRLLKPGGCVVITNLTPRISYIWHKIAVWDRDQKTRGMNDGEVWGFTDKQLQSLLSSAGFRLTKRKHFMWGLNNLYIFENRSDR